MIDSLYVDLGIVGGKMSFKEGIRIMLKPCLPLTEVTKLPLLAWNIRLLSAPSRYFLVSKATERMLATVFRLWTMSYRERLLHSESLLIFHAPSHSEDEASPCRTPLVLPLGDSGSNCLIVFTARFLTFKIGIKYWFLPHRVVVRAK